MKYIKTTIIASMLLLSSGSLLAGPFATCPSKAFLVQQSVAMIYGVNLVTGGYQLLSDSMGTTGKINAIGFNFHDNYIYGWGYEAGTLIQIGDDYQAVPLNLTNQPASSFYVGDVAVNENAYYFYRPGASWGLYRASLDPNDADYLAVTRIANGSALNLNIYDLAFHPTLSLAYSVDGSGNLREIDVSTGTQTNLGYVGQRGTFGAVYFDVEENFYISRNSDGHIFRIDVSAAQPTAEFFAYGPSSGNNDGARCAIAPVIDDTVPADTDFGDAPESYGTTLSGNGARHGISGIYLGATVDAEYDANVYPASDNDIGSDEDGIIFLTPFVAGFDSLVEITATGSGYLNVWADWNQDGEFSASEQLVVDEYMSDQTEQFFLNTPLSALNGNTWLRARISSTQSIVAYGGVSDGEVEDYRIQVMNDGLTLQQHSPVYVAFEDNWPQVGDYDMNDVIVKQSSSVLINEENEVVLLEITGTLEAMGAGYSNGFAIQLDGISPTNINSELLRFEVNGTPRSGLIESGTSDMVLMIAQNLKDEVSPASGCSYYRTEAGCEQSVDMMFSLKVPFETPIALTSFPDAPFNPFIFATPGIWHGSEGGNMGRPLEIHLKNHQPTSKADQSLFGVSDDASSGGLTYQNVNGLPWALVISAGSGNTWSHPLERVDLLAAYPDFAEFVTSSGNSAQDWYEQSNAVTTNLYSN